MDYIFFIILILVVAIICLICALMLQKNKYLKRLDYHERHQTIQQEDFEEKCSMYIKEIKQLKEQLNTREEEFEKLDKYDVIDTNLEDEPIYEGKKALIGDYMASSYNISKRVLKSFGFEVDVVRNKEDVINKIKLQNDYDIIFSNNVYPDGSGPDCLKELKQIEGFSIPVVIYTITKDAREYFIDTIGFDEYIVKPLNKMKVKKALENVFKN